MLTEDIRVDLNIRVGFDILFDLGQPYSPITDELSNDIWDDLGNPILADGSSNIFFNPAEDDYFTITDGVATLHKVH